MDIFQKEIQELCDAFNKNDVRYLLVGGFAVTNRMLHMFKKKK